MFEGIKGALQLAIIDMILVFIVLGGLALVMVLLRNIVSVKSPKEVKTLTPAVINAPKFMKKKLKMN